MPIPPERTIDQDEIRNFGKITRDLDLGSLNDIQTVSYARLLESESSKKSGMRREQGIEGILQEIFPITSYDGQYQLEYVKYELGKPRYTPTECRQLRLTYGRPFRVWLRLVKEQPIEEEVYLGDIPIMIGGGEFIINGAERVVVSQLHRSPGVDFVMVDEPGERKTHSCRIIPERGSWIELVVGKKDTLSVRIDQSGKFSAMTLLRAMDDTCSTDASLIEMFYETEVSKTTPAKLADMVGRFASDNIIYPVGHDRVGEIIVDAGRVITEEILDPAFGLGSAHSGKTHGVQTFPTVVEHDEKFTHSPPPEPDPACSRSDWQAQAGLNCLWLWAQSQ